ncbi:hypothetical protein PG996_016070 [Apiospora saccharicola]|uniref:Uncharacterized protein n=1 Tax=Apiospora saccharicola TaxID=335842 RepID=A0ABR1TQ75_9PEZI
MPTSTPPAMPTSDDDIEDLRELGRINAECKWVICQDVHVGETKVCGRVTLFRTTGGDFSSRSCGRPTKTPGFKIASHRRGGCSTNIPTASASSARGQQGEEAEILGEYPELAHLIPTKNKPVQIKKEEEVKVKEESPDN